MQFIVFLTFTLLVGGIAYWSTRKVNESTQDGFFLGGRSLTAVVIAGSLLLTNLSTEQLVGLNGSSFKEGILVMAWEVLAAIAMIVTALFLLPRYLKGGLTTVPQFLQRRYDTTTKTFTSVLFLSGYMIILLPTVLYSGALALIGMFDLTSVLGLSFGKTLVLTIVSIGFVGSIYAIFGGLKAVAVSDTVNAVGLLIGGLMIPIFGLLLVGDGNLFNGMETLYNSHPEKFKSIGDNQSSIPFGTLFTGMMLVQLFYWGTNQAIIQRALAAKNLKEGQRGLLLAAVVKILGPLIVVLPGIIAFYLFGDQLSVDNQDQSYGLLVNRVLPPVLLGFFAAVLFGAILSSFNSALNSSITLFGLDIYKQYFNKKADEREVVRSGKSFGVLLAIFSMVIAPNIASAPEGLFSYLQEVNGCYSIPILTIIVVGYLTKHIPALAAKISMITGVGLYSFSQFYLKGLVESNGGDYPHYLHIMAIIFLLNCGLMFLIGALKPRAIPYKQTYTKQVDITPWKYAKIASTGVFLIVLIIYTLLA